MFRILILSIICVAGVVCPWSGCGFAQENQQNLAADGIAPTESAQKQEQGPVMPKVMGQFGDLRMTLAKGRVTDVIDGVTLDLDNKTVVRLSGIWVPWENASDPGDTVRRAQALLKRVAEGRFVRLYQSKKEGVGQSNRLGQKLAQVERDDGLWLQGILLYAGLAMVMTTESNPESAARMYLIEEDARKRKAGLWADPRWGVIGSSEAGKYANEYRVVEGKVYSTATRNNTFYLNFSRDWKTDFTVMVPTEKRLAFARAHIDLMSLNGKTIRVRGWIRKQDGAVIEITHPEQIEILK